MEKRYNHLEEVKSHNPPVEVDIDLTSLDKPLTARERLKSSAQQIKEKAQYVKEVTKNIAQASLEHQKRKARETIKNSPTQELDAIIASAKYGKKCIEIIKEAVGPWYTPEDEAIKDSLNACAEMPNMEPNLKIDAQGPNWNAPNIKHFAFAEPNSMEAKAYLREDDARVAERIKNKLPVTPKAHVEDIVPGKVSKKDLQIIRERESKIN